MSCIDYKYVIVYVCRGVVVSNEGIFDCLNDAIDEVNLLNSNCFYGRYKIMPYFSD